MTVFDFDEIAARLTENSVVNLDDILQADRKPESKGSEVPVPNGASLGAKSSICWPLINPDQANIGVRISNPIKNRVELASALIAMAAERNMTPIIMSQLDLPDFSQFGFRIERIAGSTAQERAICEDEIMKFYSIAVLVDAENFLSMK